MSASQAAKEVLWLRQLLVDMHLKSTGSTIVFEDNQGCIKMVNSDRCGARTKHIVVIHHQLRELQERKIIEMRYCPSQEMTADVMTKPLGKLLFQRFVNKLGLQD